MVIVCKFLFANNLSYGHMGKLLFFLHLLLLDLQGKDAIFFFFFFFFVVVYFCFVIVWSDIEV